MFYRPVVMPDSYVAETTKDEVETNFHLKPLQQQQQQQHHHPQHKQLKQPQEEVKNENTDNHKLDLTKKKGSCVFPIIYFIFIFSNYFQQKLVN